MADDPNPVATDKSPRASGPAGSQFEIKVATHYALALLAETEPFGLPSALVREISFQRGAHGHPLDDIILKGYTAWGETRILDLQVKRSMAFTAADDDFASIVSAIVQTRSDAKTEKERYYAVAVERTSGPIETGVQEVLQLSRSVENSERFYSFLNSKGRSNYNMRSFVQAFQTHLNNNDIEDKEELFSILNRFSVIVFDYARPNSIAETSDRQRAKMLTNGIGTADLYDSIFGYIGQLDSIGGGKTRQALVADLQELGVSLAGSPNLAKARARLDELSALALSDINESVHGVSIIRPRRNREIEEALHKAESTDGIVEIAGLGGVGKSALLKTQAFRRRGICRILALAPDRTPRGGWPALRQLLEIDAEGEDFFADLVCDGGGLVCIDGLDRFLRSDEQRTVIDILRFAAKCPGCLVLFTARSVQDGEPFSWLPDEVREILNRRRTVIVGELDDEEAEALGHSAPELAALLKGSHPARPFTRNLFILRRLAATRPSAGSLYSEAQIAADWWTTGGHGSDEPLGAQRARRRVLAAVVQSMILDNSVADVSGYDAEAVEGLVTDEVLAEIGGTDQVKFRHDLFSDWAIGCYLSDEPARLGELARGTPPPHWLSQAFGLACRRIAELHDETVFRSLLDRLSEEGTAPSWLGLAVLALPRSEQANELLEKFSDTLLARDGEYSAVLIRRALAAHGRVVSDLISGFLPSDVHVPDGLTLPSDQVWSQLVVWTVGRFDTLPAKTLAATLELYKQWMVISAFIKEPVTEVLLERIADLLTAHIEDDERRLEGIARNEQLTIRYPVGERDVSSARTTMALFAQQAPVAATRYLEAVTNSKRVASYVEQLLEFSGSLPAAAPTAFAAALLRVVELDARAAAEASAGDRRDHPLWRLDAPFLLGKAGVSVFLSILQSDIHAGLKLIGSFIHYAEQSTSGRIEGYDLELLGTVRRVVSTRGYGWSRGAGPSYMLSDALIAIELWAHEEIEKGRQLTDVVNQILSDKEISSATLQVAVDLVLCHGTVTSPILWDFLCSPETLALDALRHHRDSAERMSGRAISSSLRAESAVDRELKEELFDRPSRGLALHDAISQVVWSLKEDRTQPLRDRLSAAGQRIGTWDREDVDWSSPRFMASCALLLASRENYQRVDEIGSDGRKLQGWCFVWPEPQRKWLESQSAEVVAEQESFLRTLSVRTAMNRDSHDAKATVEMADRILAETENAQSTDTGELHDPKDPWINRIAAAAFIARFGSVKELQIRQANLAQIFDQALAGGTDSGRLSHEQVMYNPQALAITGLVYIAGRTKQADDIRRLLHAVSDDCSSAVAAFLGHREAVRALGPRVVQAAVRIGIEACVIARSIGWDEDPDAYEARSKAVKDRRSNRMKTEELWLNEIGDAPPWPCPPPRRVRRPRRYLRIPGSVPESVFSQRNPEPPDYYFLDQTAADWTRILTVLGAEGSTPVKALLSQSKNWLHDANCPAEDVDETDIDWNWTRALMERAGEHAKAWSSEERQDLVFQLLTVFSDYSFLHAASAFLLQSDLHHIEGSIDDAAYLVSLRKEIWKRLKDTHQWKSHKWRLSTSIERSLNELVSVFFFKISRGFGVGQDYTGGLSQDQLVSFLPTLTEISVEAGPCQVVGSYLLDVLEMIDGPIAAPFAIDASFAWSSGASSDFWNDLDAGRRICAILKSVSVDSENIDKLLAISDAVSAAGVIEGEVLRAAVVDRSLD